MESIPLPRRKRREESKSGERFCCLYIYTVCASSLIAILIVEENPPIWIDYSVVAGHEHDAGQQHQHDRAREADGNVVDRAVRALRAAAHFADVQQVGLQRIEDGLIEAFWNEINGC